ncbi:WD40 repeat domain-containing protein [Candidatus Dependentiae bacterium]|nr:WD40 repeat domain-containing protein [Candidatus Dependentiae bacterium]
MKYITRHCMFFVLGLMIGSYAQGMEVTVKQESSPVTSTARDRWDDSKTQTIRAFLNGLPRELKWYILSLFLEMKLSYNFECSKNFSVGQCSATSYSSDGTTVITLSTNHIARLWDITTGEQLSLLEGHTGIIGSGAVSDDGTTALTGSCDNTARLWNVKTGQQLQVITGHTGWVTSVAFSPDGTTVLTGSRDKTARLWAVKTGQQLHLLKGHTGEVSSVAYSPDGTTVLT